MKQIATFEHEQGIELNSIDDHTRRVEAEDIEQLKSDNGFEYTASAKPASFELCEELYRLNRWDDDQLDHYQGVPLYGEDYLHDKLKSAGRVMVTDDEPVLNDAGQVVPFEYQFKVSVNSVSTISRALVDCYATLCIEFSQSGDLK